VIENLLRKESLPTLFGLLALCALAWAYLVSGAGLGGSAWEMTSLVLFPHRHTAALDAGMAGMAMPVAEGVGTWALLAGMWLAMMVAMMAPSATPAILLYARAHTYAQAKSPDGEAARAPVTAFVLGYFAVWAAFSLLAAWLQLLLEQRGVVSAMSMGLSSRWLAGSVLVAAGLYQLTPLKQACLTQCRAPAIFLSQHWRPGAAGAFRLGLLHGSYCLGCCWLLMALLFVGGVMNLVWIAALGVLVLLEKASGPGRAVGRGLGLLFIAWGLATFFV